MVPVAPRAGGDGLADDRPPSSRLHQPALEPFSTIRSVRLQADRVSPAKAGRYVLMNCANRAGGLPSRSRIRATEGPMKALHLGVLLALLAAQPMFAQRGPALRSPELHPDDRVTFRLAAPNATDVRVSGDFLPAPQALQKDDKGIWTVTVGPVSPELYAFTLSVNGVAATRGTLDVPGPAPMFYDLRPVAHGARSEE